MVEDLSASGGSTYDFSNITIKPVQKGEDPFDIWFIASEKDGGKTTLALSFEGSILVFSYDGKTQAIWEEDYGSDPRITIHNINRMMDKSIEGRVNSGAFCTDYVMKVLYSGEKEYDWVFHDYAEGIPWITEMKGRKMQNVDGMRSLGPYDQVWKKRKGVMEDMFFRSKKMARKGLIYTGWAFRDNIIVDGKTVHTGMKQPKFIKDIETETDVAVIIEVEEERKGNYIDIHRYGFMHTSKRQAKWKKYHYYNLDTLEDAAAFTRGEGEVIDRTPPEMENIKKIMGADVEVEQKDAPVIPPGKDLA